MTETSYPVATTIGHDYAPAPLLHDAPGAYHQHHAVSAHIHEDDGQISCICGYNDDDGWTVACDSCNRWQHQLCYYPQFEDRSLPEELQHYCIDCRPQLHVDPQGAHARQKVRREEHASLMNGVKRPPPKSHKKKVKEPGYTNGWPLDKSRHDRNSASPRDQPPPAKRPKTSHRTSDSVSTVPGKGHARKRTATNVNHRRSLSRSPEYPADLYTAEFIRAHMNDDWAITNTNLHNSIRITNALSDWLNAPDDVFREEHGHEKTEVLNRWDGILEDIPGKAQLEFPDDQDERATDSEGNVLTWKTVTVSESVANGAYIGEVKGHLGFKEEYMNDPANRWSLLRHPEPFVFFHPRLPIYIDARHEGTELRYVRRSCKPNAKLQILVTDQTDYRFCFMATQQIDPGMEIAVSWDTSEGLSEIIARVESVPSHKDMVQLSSWASMVLANWGPCACQSTECLMARFDHRPGSAEYDDEAPAVKMLKATKKKKAGHQISPLNTNFNSRSGSEARKVDPDDEPSDSRSASGSGGRGSVSRDITPNTHYSHTGSTSAIPELSARERKKLEKEEEMFRRQEEEQTGGKGKKKRNSGGSALNTPNTTSSKQFGFGNSSKYADAGTSKQTGLPSAKPGRKTKSSNGPKTPVKTITKIVKRPTPDYAHAEVQCDLDAEDAEKRKHISPPRKPFLSVTQRLLQRCALNNARRRGPAAAAEAANIVKVDDKMEVDRPAAEGPPPSPRPMEQKPLLAQSLLDDTEMQNIEPEPAAVPAVEAESSVQEKRIQEPPPSHSPGVSSHLPVDPPVPPWPSQAAHSAAETSIPSPHSHRPPDMHVQMPPPPPSNLFASQMSLPALSPNSVTGNPVLASPAALNAPSLFSPAVTAAVTPSPAKKKMSLSDYTKRSKAKDKESETSRADRDSSPASVASGPAVPLLHASVSDIARANEGGSSAVEDDVKMEDAGDSSLAAMRQ